MKLELCLYGHPVLRVRAEPVENFDRELAQLAQAMLEFMHARRGVGLAAQQVGKTLSICVVHVPKDLSDSAANPEDCRPLVLVNPEIIERTGSLTETEGCLSFPEIWAPVERAGRVTVRYQDVNGKDLERSVGGLAARAIQHELDHLNGVLFVDRVSLLRRLGLSGKLERLKKQAQQ